MNIWHIFLYKFDMWRRIRRVKCLLTDHNFYTGREQGSYEPVRCKYCCYTEEEAEKDLTLHKLLNKIVAWLVEKDWCWFRKVDMWLLDNYSKKLPNWYEY